MIGILSITACTRRIRLLKEYSSEYLNAAHERADATAEEKAISDAIMMDDDEWK